MRKWWPRRPATPFPHEWSEVLGQLDFAPHLTPELRRRWEAHVATFLDRVHWEGRKGLQVTDAMRLAIAGQACRLILCLDDDLFRLVRTIYLFPSTYSAESVDSSAGVALEGRSARLGEAWMRGPMVLSWKAVQEGMQHPELGHNVVYHEFAHMLDTLDRYADGTPPLEGRAAYDAWVRIVGAEYHALVHAAAEGRPTLLDPYGATNTAEFFAVATEAFFGKSQRLREAHPDLYGCLKDFYRQDPALEGESAAPQAS
ncbi:MAG: zinc-dependent peptidase [Planctomycetes bacterium]|nr:zinc-dependent peptidase [Planctomycetota bacterium]HPF14979.1 zinc-dependent peptidase [Planctomycetota bacterium]